MKDTKTMIKSMTESYSDDWDDLPARDLDSDPPPPADVDWEAEETSITGSTYSGQYGPVRSLAEYREFMESMKKADKAEGYKPPHVFGRRQD